MKLTITTYAWLKRFEKAFEDMERQMTEIKKNKKLNTGDVVKLTVPFAKLGYEYRQYVLPTLRTQKARELNYQRLGLLVTGGSIALLLSQIAIFYLAKHSYYEGFWECLLNRCAREALYEPLVWLSVIGTMGGLVTLLGWPQPLIRWLRSED